MKKQGKELVPFSFFPRSFFRFPTAIWEDFEDFNTETGLTVSENKENVFVEAHLPGLKKDEIEITLDQGILLIRGDKSEEKEDQEKNFFQKAKSSFSYRCSLPELIDSNQEPVANYENGVLKLTFKKLIEKQAKKIKIK